LPPLDLFDTALIGVAGDGLTELFSQTSQVGGESTTDVSRVGQEFVTGSSVVGATVQKAIFYIKIGGGTPTGTITCNIRNSADSIELELGTMDSGDLTAGYVEYSFENLTGHVLANEDKITIEKGANVTNYITVGHSNANPEANTSEWYYTASWNERAGVDCYLKLFGVPA